MPTEKKEPLAGEGKKKKKKEEVRSVLLCAPGKGEKKKGRTRPSCAQSRKAEAGSKFRQKRGQEKT